MYTLEEAVAVYPNLTEFGFTGTKFGADRGSTVDLAAERAKWLTDERLRAAVAKCIAWLRNEASRTPGAKGGEGSYGLKHVVERWSGEYIPNGAMIMAALMLDIPVEQVPDTPNALIAVRSPAGAGSADKARFAQAEPAEVLRGAGEALFGLAWIGPLSTVLDVDRRRVERMANGKASVPLGLLDDLASIVDACAAPARDERRAALVQAAQALRATMARESPPDP